VSQSGHVAAPDPNPVKAPPIRPVRSPKGITTHRL
jgi:hypothetical protein